MTVFGENWGLNVKAWFRNPQKAHACAEPPSQKIVESTLLRWVREVTHAQKRNPLYDLDEILQGGKLVGTPDLFTPENVCDDRTRGLGSAGGQIFRFPIDFDRRPYNTRTTERVCDI